MTRPASRNDPHKFAVAVVIPLYNKANFIRRTFASVLAQTLAPAEVIIVDDGSTDGSADAIADLVGGKVRLIQQDNAGPGPARNRGIAAAQGEWVALIDGDDLWAPNHLATLAEVADAFPKAALLATRIRSGTGDSLPSAHGPLDARMADYFSTDPSEVLLCSSTVAIRRTILVDSGGFGDFWPGEDIDLWARLALDHPLAVSGRCTALYRQATGGLMERYEAGDGGAGELQPIFATLERALSDPAYQDRHEAIRAHRAMLLRRNVRYALYHGRPSAARRFAVELKRHGDSRLGWLAALCWLPAPVLRVAIAVRRRFRKA